LKHCPHCNRSPSEVEFFKHKRRAGGLSILCKPCYAAYEGTPERRATRTWNTINARVREQDSYKHVRVSMTRDEYLSWAIPEFKFWMSLHPGLVPSLDRIDPMRNYEVGNLRILERGENSRLASNHPNVHAPDGHAWCGGACKTYLSVSSFWRAQGNYNGLQKKCKNCTTAALKKSRGSHGREPQTTQTP
jgi:hypothetical protein